MLLFDAAHAREHTVERHVLPANRSLAFRRDATPSRAKPFFPRSRNHPETDSFYQCGVTSAETAARMSSVVELVVAVVALASAGIFLAHAIEAYRA
jgi:hypothetical protein